MATKKTTISATTLLLVVVAVGLLIFYFKDKIKSLFAKKGDTPFVDAPVEEPTKTSGSTGGTKPLSKPLPDYDDLNMDKVLKVGSKGAEVVALQLLLNKLSAEQNAAHTPLVADGVFGSKTENALYRLRNVRQTNLGKMPINKLYKSV